MDDADAVPEQLEQYHQALGCVRVVLDDQDPRSRRNDLGGRRRRHQLFGTGSKARQPHPELRALPRFALDLHASAVQLHQPPHDREPDPEPTLRAIERRRGLGEEIEHPGLHLRGDADAVVPDP